MKKWTKILAIGTCLALGATGMVACGDPDNKKPGGDGANNCVYYLAGASLGAIFDVEENGATVSRDWYEKYMKASEVPDAIHFAPKAGEKNVWTLTGNFYKSDNFGILTVGEGWGGQMGANILDPQSENAADPLHAAPGGGNVPNIECGVAGNYTLTLNTADASNPVLTYVRNGDPTVAIHVDYDYYIKGAAVSGGNTMYVDYLKFAGNEAKDTYTLTIGMQENDKFTFASIMEQDNSQKPEFKSGDFTLDTGAATAAAIEVEKAAGEGAEEEPTGNFKIKGGTGTYQFTITEDADNKLTLKAEKTSDEVPAYDYYIVMADKTKPGDITAVAYEKMTLNATTGKYEIEKTLVKDDWVELAVVPAGTAADKIGDNVKYSVRTEYATPDYLSDQLDVSGGNWVMTNESDTFTITLDPTSMIVKLQGAHDTVTYNVFVYGNLSGSGWVDHEKAEVKIKGEAPYKGTIVQELAVGDEFGIRTLKKGSDTQIGWGSNGNVTGDHAGLGTEGNFKATEAGTYTFVVTIDEEGNITDITVTKA